MKILDYKKRVLNYKFKEKLSLEKKFSEISYLI